jgi:PIN domain nuclease of toxin-antitoxin system
VRLLIDSHAFIWWRDGSRALGPAASNAISDPSNEVLISIAGLWELTIKEASGKLTLPTDLETMVVEEGFSILPVSFSDLRTLKTLPRIHRDPFDRMMIAQALVEGIPIATRDRVFAAYGVQIVW